MSFCYLVYYISFQIYWILVDYLFFLMDYEVPVEICKDLHREGWGRKSLKW